jgi:hypothetical protein
MEGRLFLPPFRYGLLISVSARDLDPDSVGLISSLVAGYIEEQRDRYKARATPLSSEQKATLHGFFRDSLLNAVLTKILIEERLSNPEFFSMAHNLGISDLPDFSAAEAVTFEHVVVSHEPFSNGLLFHELVHVEQYRQLGVSKFAELYVRGFLFSGGYDRIPLERNAYELGGRFESAPNNIFSVEDSVATWIRDGRF